MIEQMILKIKKFKTNDKGQIFSSDLMIAGIIFLLILTLSLVYSNDVANKISILEQDNLREQAVQNAANALVYSPGKPANWQNFSDLSGIFAIGIADSRNVIDPTKINQLVILSQTDYDQIKDLLGLSKYGLKVSIIDLLNNQVFFEFGVEPGSNQSVSAVNRFALLDGQDVIVRVKVFEK